MLKAAKNHTKMEIEIAALLLSNPLKLLFDYISMYEFSYLMYESIE